MNEINRITSALRPHLKWHGARLNFLALFLVALFRVETVNLYGCDFLGRTFVDFSLRLADFNQALQLLSPY